MDLGGIRQTFRYKNIQRFVCFLLAVSVELIENITSPTNFKGCMPESQSVFSLYQLPSLQTSPVTALTWTFPPDLSKTMVKHHYFHLGSRETYAPSSDVACLKGKSTLWIPEHTLSTAICCCSPDLGTEIASLLPVMAVGLSHKCACSDHLWALLQSIAGLKDGCITVHNTQSAAVSHT